MGKPITNITIVGGGTTGWIVAAYLNQRLQWSPSTQRDVKITLIESPEIGTIGVGEATVPTLKGTLKTLNISEAEFMERTDASFKLGIWFHDWNRNAAGEPLGYLHPFTGGLTIDGLHPGFGFKKYGLPNRATTDQDYVRAISHAREAVDAMRGPRALNGPMFRGALQYAYHIDAGKLADFLREVCVARGINHIKDNVVDVKLDERGYVSALQLKDKGEWPVEFVIDCSGFRGLIINQALKEPFEVLFGLSSQRQRHSDSNSARRSAADRIRDAFDRARSRLVVAHSAAFARGHGLRLQQQVQERGSGAGRIQALPQRPRR